MTVAELVRLLSDHDGGTEVYLAPVIYRVPVTNVDPDAAGTVVVLS
jgi:hypothetical protein